MLERIVENWLTRAGERGYETPFAQLLSVEGHRVLHGPVHHPFEHGKDIISLATDGSLCAFQLKGGDIDLRELESIQQQLYALARSAVTYPGVMPPRRPDQVTLVSSGVLTPPARDRIASLNIAQVNDGLPPIRLVEREHLVGRFVAANQQYLPTEPEDLNSLLQFYLSDGHGPFPTRELARLLAEIQVPKRANRNNQDFSRAVASSVLLTSYVCAPWERLDNHLAVAEAWLTLALQVLRVAASHSLPDEVWKESFALAVAAGRGRLRSLLDECSSLEDLVVPDLVEGVVYPMRAIKVCGWMAAFYLSERALDSEQQIEAAVRALLVRELPYVKASGEAETAPILMMATALPVLDEADHAIRLALTYSIALARLNGLGSGGDALPDPYHAPEENLLRGAGLDEDFAPEQFDGNAYTLHVLIEWFARRGGRPILEKMWGAISRVTFCETRVSSPEQYLAIDDENADLAIWPPNSPESWTRLNGQAAEMRESALPGVLWRNLEYLPYLPLLFPYRLTADVGRALDYLVLGTVSVTLDAEPDE